MLNVIRSIYLYTVYRLFKPLIDKIILYDVYATIFIIAIYLVKGRKYKAVKYMKKGFEDHRLEVTLGGVEYDSILKRIIDAYQKAKEDQKKVNQPAYEVGIQWQHNLDHNYGELKTALSDYNIESLKGLLENFSRPKRPTKQPIYKYLFINTWYKYYDLCRQVTGKTPVLTYPLVGNPVGLYHDNKVIPIDAIRFYYCATQMLLLLDGIDHPIIAEIGSGHGGQIYTVISSSQHPLTYINLDIPEMLVKATYFLMVAFPEKRFLLYGEGGIHPSNLKNYDMVMLPHFTLPQLGDETVDLFFNQRSFCEMGRSIVIEYIHQIERICRGYLMHINHNNKSQFEENLPGTEIVPDPKTFKKIYQYPWMFNKPSDEINYKGTDYIAFLFEKRKT